MPPPSNYYSTTAPHARPSPIIPHPPSHQPTWNQRLTREFVLSCTLFPLCCLDKSLSLRPSAHFTSSEPVDRAPHPQGPAIQDMGVDHRRLHVADRRFKRASDVRQPPVMTTPRGSPTRRAVGGPRRRRTWRSSRSSRASVSLMAPPASPSEAMIREAAIQLMERWRVHYTPYPLYSRPEEGLRP